MLSLDHRNQSDYEGGSMAGMTRITRTDIRTDTYLDLPCCGFDCPFKYLFLDHTTAKCLLFNEPLQPFMEHGSAQAYFQCDQCRWVVNRVWPEEEHGTTEEETIQE